MSEHWNTPDAATGLAMDYEPAPERYDEMHGVDGGLRPPWQALVQRLGELGRDELGRRWQEARRLLRENGVTYNVYDDPEGVERLWRMDAIPMLLERGEWARLERGLAQRARLLEAVVADLYGPRTLLRRGVLPPELILAHPGFLRPCAGVPAPGGRHLPVYAADLARAPDGQVWVIGDRAQAPSGAGYALENRIILSRVLPHLLRELHVQRLAGFFAIMRETLANLAPLHRDDPGLVLLTPGPGNETYFEHAFLASHLGCTLVQGDDLMVRDERVWLTTLEGLRPVDVIVRRVDDTFCDPLELRGDSVLGTPGLLQAARLGHVSIVNPLGCGIVENPGLMAFLPALARLLLDEDLVLPSVATWWCGGDKARAYVLEHLTELVIKPVSPQGRAVPILGAALSAAELDGVRAMLTARPHLFAAQEHVALSTAPVLAGSRFEPRPLVVRSFLVAHGDGYAVMPGGLGRVAPSADSWVVSNQSGGVSKDTWVLGEEGDAPHASPIAATPPLAIRRGGDEVPGRVADNLYWLGRYAERTEGTARLIREVLRRLLAPETVSGDGETPVLLRAVTYQTATYPGFIGAEADERFAAPERELVALIADGATTGSLRFDVDALVRAGRSVRDWLSIDTWRVISRLDQELADVRDAGEALDALERLVLLLAAFAGFTEESMTRGQSWRFLAIGRHLERAMHTAGLVRGVVGLCHPGETPPWEAVLSVTHSLMAYRRRYRAHVHAGAVLDLVLADEGNPRSVRFQLLQLNALVAGLASGGGAARQRERDLARDALVELRGIHLEAVAGARGADGAQAAVDEALARVQQRLTALADHLTRSYFGRGDRAQLVGGAA